MPPVPPGATVAITGATGFIGSHTVAAALAAGYNVRAVVRDPNNEEKNAHLKALPGAERLAFVSGSLDKEGSYDEAFVGADAVIHTAAVVEIDSVKDGQKQIVDPSVSGTKNVLASADKAGTLKRFVHTSSIIATMEWDKPEIDKFSERNWNSASTVANGDPYGFAKAEAEKLVHNHTGGAFDCVAILPGVNLGPCMNKAHTKASAVVVRQFLYGNSQKEYFAHFVDVRDTAAGLVKALVADLPAGEQHRFIVTSDEQMQISALEAPLKRLYPNYYVAANPYPSAALSAVIKLPLLWRIFISEFERSLVELKVRMDNSRSKEVLGVQYRPLDDTLRDTVESMKGHIKIKTLKPEPPAGP